MARKRVIYQSEALFSAATGAQGPTDINQIHRVQDISHSVEVARTDVNEFGKLAALSREVIEVPTVSADFSYYVIDGHNEASGLGLTVDGHNVSSSTNCLSGIMNTSANVAEKNYYVLTVPEGSDATQDSNYDATAYDGQGVIGIGKGILTSYGLSASVGEIPSASISVEASNLRFDTSGSGFSNPAIDIDGNGVAQTVQLPTSSTGHLQAFAVRPGDITVDFGAGLLQQGGVILPGMTSADSKACVQSVSIDLPLSRTPLQCMGSIFPKSRELDLPISASLTVNANLADISSGALNDLICSDGSTRNISIELNTRCKGSGIMRFDFKGAQLDSQSMSSSIGDNKSVDLTFSAQVGGPQDANNGVFISGSK
jgi:hypothetical protein